MADLTVSLEPWTEADLPLLVRLNAPGMMTHRGGPETAEQLALQQLALDLAGGQPAE